MKYSILTAALLAVALAACDKQDDAMPASSPEVVTPDQATPVMPAPAPAPEAAAPAEPAAAPEAAAPTAPAPEAAAMPEPAPVEAMPDAQTAAPADAMPVDAMAPAAGETPAAPAAAQGAAAMSIEEGSALAKKSGCFACHNVERKIIGPSWNDVGAKYKDDPAARDNLVKWIHTGGTGRWGTAVMPPYSPRVADADIEKLADFILSLPQS
jgi:cytochrome c